MNSNTTIVVISHCAVDGIGLSPVTVLLNRNHFQYCVLPDIFLNIISYIGFRQVIQAHITCLCFIFPEPKAREIYNADRLYEPVLP